MRRGICKHCHHEIEQRPVGDNGSYRWIHVAGPGTGLTWCDRGNPALADSIADPLGGGEPRPMPTPLTPTGQLRAEAEAMSKIAEALAELDNETAVRVLGAVAVMQGFADAVWKVRP